MKKPINEEIKIGDEVVFNNPDLGMSGKFEVVSISEGSNDGKSTLGVRPSRKLNDKAQYIDELFATRTGATYDHTSLLDILSVPQRKSCTSDKK